ncbi:MAG: helix-turn-helix transcriptional regulator [Planctomycetota bacterium]|jgi:AraC-like DNA-binding protein
MARSARTSSLLGTVVASPIESVSGVWRFSREPGGTRRARSLPGHLLHLVISGSYRLRTNAREYAIRTGDVIYYHETEEVEWLGNVEPVVFYSVGFLAPEVPPLPVESRVFPSTEPIRGAFDDLYAAALTPPGVRRALGVHLALLRIVLNIDFWREIARPERPAAGRDWWAVESLVRERRMFRPTLGELARLTHRSRASLVRACRAATGTSPMRRIRDLRMAEARGLLRYSTLNVSQVAAYLGYPRVHEFSREFGRVAGESPSAFRRT